MKNILVTGGAGFIGSNFIEYFLSVHQDCQIVNLDALTYAGDTTNLRDLEKFQRYEFIKGNICDRPLVERLFDNYSFDGVFHFAAESHVDNSILGPEEFIRTNIFGTFELLDVARRKWMREPFAFQPGAEGKRFLHVSTDEVYGSLGAAGLFTETSPYAPNSPYSASKAGSDFLVRSYFHTYGMPVVTTNCSNNYGPRQHDEKLIPTIIRNALAGKPIPIYGDGKNIRDWLYVADHCRGIDLVFQKGKTGETYNIGGRNEKTNIEIARTICGILDTRRPKPGGRKYEEQIAFVKDRAGHDRRYAIDAAKIESQLGWRASETFETGIGRTVDWYIRKYS